MNGQHQTRLVDRMQEFAGVTIFAQMSALATRTGAVNLGQGFPDVDGPTEVSEAAVAAIRSGRYNQYPQVSVMPSYAKLWPITNAASGVLSSIPILKC